MNTSIPRREFLRRSGLAASAAAAWPNLALSQGSPASAATIRVGVMGLSRGMAHINALMAIPDVRIAYVCDVDDTRLEQGLKRVADRQEQPAKAVKDFRRILDDPSVDALTIATPNFWHAPATILACAAGKHVYVEKPGSHNAHEAELMVRAARKYHRQVQMGNQRRSWPAIIEMMEKLHSGAIGQVHSARCWYSGARPSIGHGKQVPVPDGLDYALWQGPAPTRPYVDNLVHYNWHWRWHWGGGELANNGIHALDLARWGLGVNFPARVTYNGGRYHFDDDQETPDTGVAVYDFGKQCATWDCSSCHPRRQEDLPFIAFYGEGGTIENRGNGYVIYDETGKKIFENTGPGGDADHFQNFIDAVRGKAQLNAEIGDAQISTLLCHLGNIAYRTQGALRVDPTTGRIPPDASSRATQKLWTRQYQPGWEPKL